MYGLTFHERIERTPTSFSFRFTPEVPFVAGQYAKICFNHENLNDKEMNKFLSFSCGPGHGYVEFTKRISQSTFSKALLELKPGDKIHITEAKGHCTLGQPAQKVLYLAGGIGITPVVSMLDNVYSRGDFLDAVLIYANNSPVDAAFKDVFDSWNSKHGFKFECIYNFISDEIIKSLVPDWNERLAFVFGPPAMVKATREVCAKMGYAKDNVLFESFAGYTS